jgi:hypothetical protein
MVKKLVCEEKQAAQAVGSGIRRQKSSESKTWGQPLGPRSSRKKRCRSILLKSFSIAAFELLFTGQLKPAFSFFESDLRGPLAQRGDPFSQPSGSSAGWPDRSLAA